MREANIPPYEKERLENLQEYEILDTQPEVDFNDFTLLASYICQTPIALISLVDEKRQWFKSSHGIDVKETERRIAFCPHAILGKELFIVQDALTHEDFFDNPLVVNPPNVRFYAGAPLVSQKGFALGTLCVIDHSPRSLSKEQEIALMALSRQVVKLLEARKSNIVLRRSYESLQKISEKIQEQEMEIVETSKHVCLGEMAAGIAHEINNPLKSIIKKTKKIMDNVQIDENNSPNLIKEMEKIELTSIRIGKVVDALKKFSMSSKRERYKKCSLNGMIENALMFFSERIFQKNITLKYSPSKENQEIFCKQNQLQEAIYNVIQNAFEAVEGIKNSWIEIKSVVKKGDVEIRIIDSGKGVSKEILSKITQPFFTTKKFGEGAGLGLSVSKGIIEDHNGRIYMDVDSKNTCFVIELPINSLGG